MKMKTMIAGLMLACAVGGVHANNQADAAHANKQADATMQQDLIKSDKKDKGLLYSWKYVVSTIEVMIKMKRQYDRDTLTTLEKSMIKKIVNNDITLILKNLSNLSKSIKDRLDKIAIDENNRESKYAQDEKG